MLTFVVIMPVSVVLTDQTSTNLKCKVDVCTIEFSDANYQAARATEILISSIRYYLEFVKNYFWCVKYADIELSGAHVSQVVVGLARVQARVLQAECRDDVSERGGDVAAGTRPPHARHAGVGVNLSEVTKV